jgi:tetratricopeptide (TPR) repeat protein
MHIFKYGLLVALLSFSVWASEASKQSCQIQVSITGQEKVPGDVRLYLYQDGQVIKKLKVRKDGAVRAEVPPGSYQMLVSSSDMTIAGSRTAYLDTARENCAESLFVQKSQGTTVRSNAPESVNSAELSVPTEVRETFQSAMFDFRDGKVEEAKTKFLALTQQYPKISQPYNNLGVIASQEGKFKEAEQYFERAIEINPRNAAALMNFAKELVRQGNYSPALMLTERYLQVARRNAEIFLLRGWMHYKLGRFDELITDAREMHRLPHAGAEEVHLLAGMAYETKGQLENAIREYQFYMKESSNEPGRLQASTRVNTLLHSIQSHTAAAPVELPKDQPAIFSSFAPK